MSAQYDQLIKELHEQRLNSWGARLAKKLLDEYCQHKNDCAKWEIVNSEDGLKVLVSDRRPCTCGLDEIRKELE